MLLRSHFYWVSQVEFLKYVKVASGKDCHLVSIQNFQSLRFLGEYLALCPWLNPSKAHTEGRWLFIHWVRAEDLGPTQVTAVSTWAQVFAGEDILPVRATPSEAEYRIGGGCKGWGLATVQEITIVHSSKGRCFSSSYDHPFVLCHQWEGA